jgi:hypothetical protein
LRFVDELAAEAGALFAALQPASEGGGEVNGCQCSGDPLPGVLEAVLFQAPACQPPFWHFLRRKSLPVLGLVNRRFFILFL